MPTNPPPCYRCGMRPSMLPIAYCAECYQDRCTPISEARARQLDPALVAYMAERHEATERAAALSMGIPTVGAR